MHNLKNDYVTVIKDMETKKHGRKQNDKWKEYLKTDWGITKSVLVFKDIRLSIL